MLSNHIMKRATKRIDKSLNTKALPDPGKGFAKQCFYKSPAVLIPSL